MAIAAATVNVQKIWVATSFTVVVTAGAIGLGSSLALLHYNWTLWYAPNEHGYVVLAASLWLAAVGWRTSPPAALRPDWPALLPLGALVLLLAGLELLFVNNSRLLLLPPLALAALALVYGRDAAKRLVWPVAFLYFALPQWWIINGLLQNLTISAVSRAVRATHVPAFIDGSFVHLPSGTFEIASGCSGLNYLQAGTALAAFYGLTSLATWRFRLILLAAAAAAALLFNWVRVYSVILVGHFSEMHHYLIVREHHTFGWVLFMAAMVPVFLLAARLERLEARLGEAVPFQRSNRPFPIVSRSVVVAALAAAAVLIIPWAITPKAVDGRAVATDLPRSLADSEAAAPITSGWAPVFVNAHVDSASFGPTPVLDVFRAVYPQQDSEHRLIHPSNDFVGASFHTIEQHRRNVALDDGLVVEVMEHRGTLHERSRLVWTWYWVAGRSTADAFGAKLAEVRGLLAGRRDAVAIALAADCLPDCQAAEQRLAAFLARNEPSLRWPPVAQPP